MAIYSFGYGLDGQLGHSCVEEYLGFENINENNSFLKSCFQN